jgi:hypothetical protein
LIRMCCIYVSSLIIFPSSFHFFFLDTAKLTHSLSSSLQCKLFLLYIRRLHIYSKLSRKIRTNRMRAHFPFTRTICYL